MDDCSQGPWLARIFRRTACPLPGAAPRRAPLRPKHFVPLVGFLVPTAAMAYGVVMPRNGILGINELTIGFAGALVGASITYVLGLLAALRH